MAAGGGKEMEIAIKIAGKVESSFKNALGAASKGLGTITKTVASATAAAATAVGAMGIAAINTGRELEGAMSQVAATMLIDKTTAEGKKAFETLENAARECGASTAFSATEAAEALNYLALAGYDADKAATALPTVLKLAGAGAMDLATASDMVTDSMSALGIEATEANLTQFSDQLAKTASKSNTSVAQLGEAILTVGGTAKGLAGDTTELNTALGILADSGLKGAEGGTHLRNMILSLQTARNSNAAALFQEIGLSAYEAEGNMRSLGDVFGDINAALDGASAEKVNSTLSTIFKQTDLASARAMLAATTDSIELLGSVVDASLAESGNSMEALGINLQEMASGFDAATTQEQFAEQMLNQFGFTSEQAGTLYLGLQSVVNGTGNRFGELTKQIEDCAGACENMYDIQQDNLNGDIAKLTSSLSELGNCVYEDLNGPLREMTQLATSMVGELSNAYKDGGMEGMVEAVGGCLSEIINKIAEYTPQVVSMGVGLLENLISGITDNSGALATAASEVITVFVEGLFTLVPQVILAGIDILTQFVQSMTAQLPQLISTGTQAIVNFVSGIIQRLPEVISTALTLVQTLVSSIGQNAPMLISAAIQLIGNLVLGIVSMLPQLLQMGIQLILNLAQGIIANLPLLLEIGTQIIVNLVDSITQSLPYLIQGGFELITSLIHGIVQNLPAIAKAAVTIILSLIGGLITAIPQLWAAAKMLPVKIKEAIIDNDWLEIGWNLICSIGEGIIDGALSIGSSVLNTVKGWFGFGDDSEDSGKEASDSFASGINDNAGAVTAAADSMATNVFGSMNTSSAAAAGTQAGTAFSMGLTDSMATGGFDTAAFGANMAAVGTTGAAALSDGFSTRIAGTPADTSRILDTSALNADMTAAGTDGAAALAAGLNTGLSGAAINASAMVADTSGLTANLAMAGTDGAAAIGTGMTGNTQAVTQAATNIGTDINTALDSGWQKANTNAQTAMQSLVTTVTNAARTAANAVKAAFENMTITIPKPKIPVISVTTNPIAYGNGGNVSIPEFSVAWNAMGGIFNQPTIFNTAAGMQGVGEAGPEAVLPLDTLWAKMKEILNGAIAASGGTSLIDAFIERLKGIGTGGSGGQPELAGAGGAAIQYSPVYNLYGSAGKEEIAEADRMSQAEFNRLMKQYERDRQRRKL